jgi:hypothetical protein
MLYIYFHLFIPPSLAIAPPSPYTLHLFQGFRLLLLSPGVQQHMRANNTRSFPVTVSDSGDAACADTSAYKQKLDHARRLLHGLQALWKSDQKRPHH